MEFIPRIQRGNLVCFCKRRIVEYRVNEEVALTLARKHGLADVNSLGRTFTDDMHTQQLLIFDSDQQLEQAFA